ncbi:MAG: CoB--CoM heterodisulfide reductase iron-sulfur subunit B family protein [Spirochaetaceae bacterium]|nr:MAG: CoB--CoM heterodisulfide reductase iron-sulfur subunit B family protein [Spirochaetaceae bacterium]
MSALEVAYMPGCTLKTKARNFETTTLKLLELLEVRAEELPDWYCCGTTYSLASDNIMNHLGPIRTLVKAKELGRRDLLVLCSMCYNTLRRAQELVLTDEEKRSKINEFMYDEETDFQGDEVRIVHLLTLLKESIGFDHLKEKLVRDPGGLKVAAYYGCMLLRPREIAVDPVAEHPSILEDLFEACGVESVYFPFKTECCGSYQTVNEKQVVLSRTKEITRSAVKNGADLIVTSCPLCHYNLDAYQPRVAETTPGFRTIPVLYISQILALLAGLEEIQEFSLHAVDPRPVLQAKGLIGKESLTAGAGA